MRIHKRLLSILLALCMVLTLLPATALAEEPAGPHELADVMSRMTEVEDGGYSIDSVTNSLISSGALFLGPGNYVVSKNTTVDYMIQIDNRSKDYTETEADKVTLDIKSGVTLEVKTFAVLSSLEVTGTGTVKTTIADKGDVVFSVYDHNLTVGGITIDQQAGSTNEIHGVSIMNKEIAADAGIRSDPAPKVTLNGTKINTVVGVSVNGNVAASNLTLNGVTINASDLGIYQAGVTDATDDPVDVKVKDSTVTGAVTGIEVRAGKLTLENSSVTGGSGTTESKPNNSGSTTTNAALAVAQHTTQKEITVTIGGTTTLTGGNALYVSNPQSNTGDQTISVTVNGGTFNGAVKNTDTRNTTTVTLNAGTYSVKPNAEDDKVTIKDTYTFSPADGTTGPWTLGPASPLAITIGNLGDDFTFTTIGNKAISALIEGTLTVSEPASGNIVKVTGALKYAEWEAFNGDPEEKEEQAGHYLPIKISTSDTTNGKGKTVTVEGSKTKTFTFGDDCSIELAMYVDKLVNKGKGKFTVTCDGVTYTVDCTELVLLPKAVTDESGNTTEVKVEEGEGEKPAQVVTETTKDDALVGSVGLPANTDDLGKMTIEVKPVAANALPQTVQAGEKFKSAIKADTTKLVEVTVKVIKAEGGAGEEQFTSDSPMSDANIVITIGGLEGGETYHVFSIDKDGKVTSYGYKKLGNDDSTIELNSKHLTIFAAAKVTDDFKTSDVEADTAIDKGDEIHSGLTKTPGTTPPTTATYRVAAAANTIGNKVTINGNKGKTYIIQIWNGTNIPAAIFSLTAGDDGKVGFYANSGATISIWEAESASAFDGKVPTGLAKVEKA